MKVTRRELLHGIATASILTATVKGRKDATEAEGRVTDESITRDKALLSNDLSALRRDQILLNALNRTRLEMGLPPLGIPRPAPSPKRGTRI